MTRQPLLLVAVTGALCATGMPALAHVGHIGEWGGHSHWVAGIALGAAIGLAVWGIIKGNRDDQDAGAEGGHDADGEEAGASQEEQPA